MGRTLAIGDIHGQLAQFDALLAVVALKPEDHLVLLGDYVDRGPDSAGVIRRIMELQAKGKGKVTAIRGNHEEMMLAAKDGGIDELAEWVFNGGMDTLLSYGSRASVRDVPAEHWRFLKKALADYLETETHIFVHANCKADLALKRQPDYVLRWERCDRIRPHKSGKVIVCGHTPQFGGMPMNRGYAICLDTGAAYGEMLTCLEAHSGKLWQADAKAKVTRGNIADYLEQ